MSSLEQIYRKTVKELENPQDEINVRILLTYAEGINFNDFYLKLDKNVEKEEEFNSLLLRYLEGEPVQYLTKSASFLGNDFYVDNRVLIPRQETEEVLMYAKEKINAEFGLTGIDVADICTGSGCFGLSLSKIANVKKLYLSDLSEDAIEVAKINSNKLSVDGICFVGDSLEPLISKKIKVDVIVANPPYILKREDVDESVLAYEPQLALFTSEQLDVYRSILQNCLKVKNGKLLIVFEIGYDIGEKIQKLAQELTPNAIFELKKDMNGNDRMVSILIK